VTLQVIVIALTTLTLAGLIASCTQDFDGLFVSDAGAPDKDVKKVPDGDDANTCSPKAECTPKSGCDDVTCSYGCGGCACKCPVFDCPTTKTDTNCEATCASGTSCSITCNSVAGCTLDCPGCTAALSCLGGAKSCAATCTEGATCDVDCSSGACSLICATGASCLLKCDPKAGSCDLTCKEGTKTECGVGVFACNRECPI
jgi:hypothetical protein